MEKPCHHYECRVNFSDTDASGRAHFTAILVYAERAEHDLLRSHGIDVLVPGKSGWPRASVRCDYRKPLFFDDPVAVKLALQGVGRSSLSWSFEILHSGTREVAATGEIVTVKVNEQGVPMELPASEREALGDA